MNDPVMSFESVEAAHAWFDAHAGTHDGIWLRIAKGALAGTTVDYRAALDVALCHGWIDGAKKSEDDTHWQQRFTPRRQAPPRRQESWGFRQPQRQHQRHGQRKHGADHENHLPAKLGQQRRDDLAADETAQRCTSESGCDHRRA